MCVRACGAFNEQDTGETGGEIMNPSGTTALVGRRYREERYVHGGIGVVQHLTTEKLCARRP